VDILILKALGNRQRFKGLRAAVPVGMISPDTQAMLAWYELYFSSFPEHDNILVDELISLVRLRSGNADANSIGLMVHLCDQLRVPIDADSLRGIVGQLHELDLSGRAGNLVSRYNNGEEVSLAYELQMLAAQAKRAMSDGSKPNWAYKRIHEYLLEDSDEGGLQWNMFPQLQHALKGIHTGDNVAVAAPTDQGKSSLMCKIAVGFQEQAKVLYPDRPFLYLVNEGTDSRIQMRLYQTAVALQRDEMLAMSPDELEARYCAVVGHREAIKAVNIHGKSVAQVSNIIESLNPHTVITDMTGRIRATSNKSGGGNDINQLEEVWNDFRELAVIYDFAHIGSVQVSAEGFNMLYPPVSALQNSKTGIQATLDLILMMGALQNPAAQGLRGISTPKNKLAKSNVPGYNQFECYFEPKINLWQTGA
jgi:hypothetical protein